MKIKQIITTMIFGVGITAGTLLYTQPTYANNPSPNQADNTDAKTGKQCGGAETSIITCNQTDQSTGTTDNGVWALLLMAMNILTAGVGILAVGGIAYGAALYASSADKPEQAKQGMTFIKNVVTGLVAYGLMFILLNFLIPGGIFK
jgi:hypothetical protein